MLALLFAAVFAALAGGGLAGAATVSGPPANPAPTSALASTAARAGTAAPAGAAPASTAAATSAATGRVPAAGGVSPTVVTFAWGGGNASQLSSLDLFARYGMHATYYVPSGVVCFPSKTVNCATSQYLTLADVRKIAAAGNEIGGLTVSHVSLTTNVPTAEAQREICDDRVNLLRWGFPVTDFAYPFTVAQPRIESLVSRCGYDSGLGAGQVAAAGACLRCGVYAETIPPRNPYLIRAPIEVNASAVHWTPATFESIVQTAQHHGGGWIVFLIHDVCPAYCTYGITSAQLTQVLSWIDGQLDSGLKVETVHQVIGGAVKPAVPGPRPARIRGTGVANADLADAAGGYPACFQPADYGENRASFSYRPSGGPGGSATETVSLTSAQSGDAKLLQETDLGECAPPVTAGRSYAVGAWYRSTTPTEFDLYYRNQIGVWSYWITGAGFPVSATWKHVSWTTPPAPAGATAISFGLAVGHVGQVTTTGYGLTAAPPDHMKTLAFVVIGLLISAPFIGWRLWRPRAAGAPRRSASRPPGGTAGQPGARQTTGLASHGGAGRRWMDAPPAHQVVVGPETDAADAAAGAEPGARAVPPPPPPTPTDADAGPPVDSGPL
ncbi:MAG: polysaccharide deacetylase family protein [Streptosporangiaceae bacterium]